MRERRNLPRRQYVDSRLEQTTIRKRATLVMLDQGETYELGSEVSRLTGLPVHLPIWLYVGCWEWMDEFPKTER